MDTPDLDAPEKFIRKAQKLQSIADELKPFLELVNAFDGKELTMPTDRLIRAHEAAQILGVDVKENLIHIIFVVFGTALLLYSVIFYEPPAFFAYVFENLTGLCWAGIVGLICFRQYAQENHDD